ncbi:putative enterotoxin [Ophiocordyceps australis]|uniref:Putative enterotoxin n=1 Tax=Ophiocordyceps australis TaxID=1399860 RepID=A0A2C5Y333_9HYPO|nr:putative enterotoxin [Ophiocordyceps australis]
MIKLSDSLLQFDEYPEEDEYTAMGGILWEQVYGWIRLPNNYEAMTTEQLKNGESNFYDMARKHLAFNRDYNSNKFKGQPASGGQLRLAGAPQSEWPWSYYQNKPLREAALEFMQEMGGVVDWHGDFPLIAPRPWVKSIEVANEPSTWLDENVNEVPRPLVGVDMI